MFAKYLGYSNDVFYYSRCQIVVISMEMVYMFKNSLETKMNYIIHIKITENGNLGAMQAMDRRY